jgi:hypothetical protein
MPPNSQAIRQAKSGAAWDFPETKDKRHETDFSVEAEI